MRKIVLLMSIAVILSCSKDNTDKSTVHDFTVIAQIPEIQAEDGTKVVGENVIRMNWSSGDKISVVNVTTGKSLGGSLSTTGGYSAVFSGTLTGTINSGDKLAFVYPCQNYTSETNYSPINVDFSNQTTADPKVSMIAHYTVPNASTSFSNISISFAFQMSFFDLNLAELPVSTSLTSVEISGMNDVLTYSIVDGNLKSSTSSVEGKFVYSKSVTTNVRGSKTITLGLIESPAVSSRSVVANTSSSSYSAYFPNVKVEPNKYYYTNTTGFVQSIMTFKDNAVKAKCIEKYDKNNDGKLSFLEAAAVTDLGVSTKAAGDNPFPTSILHFAELQFFTGLSAIPSFEGYNMLKTVAIPSQISTISANTFKNCSALETVIFTSTTPPTVGNDAFANCDANMAIYVPTSAVSAYKTAIPTVASKVKDIAEVGADFGLEGWSDGGSIGGSAN